MPAALLDSEFAPAWPRVAALAGCMLVGFTIGVAGVDRTIVRKETQVASRDIGTMAFAPDLFSGDRE